MHVMGKNEWFCSLPFYWHFGNILSLFFHIFARYLSLFLWGYFLFIIVINYSFCHICSMLKFINNNNNTRRVKSYFFIFSG